MKKIQLLILFIFSFTIGLFAQGIVKEKQVIKSAILNKEVHYSIYLPSDYNTSERAYPVTYLLHGYGDADDGWIQFGEINRLADEGIATGKMPPMIIVTPDGFTSFYINSADGAMNYEDFFIKELIPHIEKTYKVKAERKYRGIAGLSMGGYGALIYALKYPNLFTAAAPLSAAVWTDTDIINLNDNMYNTFFGSTMGKNLKGKDRLTASWLENSPMGIIEKKTVAELSISDVTSKSDDSKTLFSSFIILPPTCVSFSAAVDSFITTLFVISIKFWHFLQNIFYSSYNYLYIYFYNFIFLLYIK
jgi:S-formylglutathione hydrolase FrmB